VVLLAGTGSVLVLGLTGGIGTGKSEVTRALAGLGASVIDADRVGHEAYRPHQGIWQEVVQAFGEEILSPDGEVDRKALGAIVFSQPDARAKLNSIMHPWMAQEIERQIDQLRQDGVEVVVLEAALLIEAGWQGLVDELWVTMADEDEAVLRVSLRSGLSEEQVRGRMATQMPVAEKVEQADVVIDNSGSLEELEWRVTQEWNGRVKGRIA
jgi:dephospho-CoA kinase